MDTSRQLDVLCKLMFIARNLKTHDKISVIFLICGKPYAGLKIIDLLLATDSTALQNKAFFTWAKKQILFSHTDWREKFSDVLALIQHYRLAKYLGFEKEELLKRLSMRNKLYTSELKVALYELCESLSFAETKHLIDSIDKENYISEEGKPILIRKSNYLERKLLDWSVKNIISTDVNKKLNLTVLLKHLINLKLDKRALDLKLAIESAKFKFLRSIKTLQSHTTLPDIYEIINKTNLGLCVIINEKSFPGSELTQRWGSNKDVERLREVFTAFGFRVKVHTDILHDQLINLLENYATVIPPTDSFFVLIILSHGSENVIYTSDSVPVSVDAIEMTFQAENCPNLIGKPKIFIIQSCQGQKWQRIHKGKQDVKNEIEESETDVDVQGNVRIEEEPICVGPQKGDCIIAWSTVQGYASFRDKHNGSWYIEELCKELWKFGHVTDLVDILTLVNNNLRSKVYDGQFMVPSLLSSLSGKIQFPYDEDNWIRGRQMMFERLFFEVYFLEFLQKTEISYVDLIQIK